MVRTREMSRRMPAIPSEHASRTRWSTEGTPAAPMCSESKVIRRKWLLASTIQQAYRHVEAE